jgi:hypothetical protein
MNTQPEALKIADALDDEARRLVKLEVMYRTAAAQLRNLHVHAVNISPERVHKTWENEHD